MLSRELETVYNLLPFRLRGSGCRGGGRVASQVSRSSQRVRLPVRL